MSDDRTDAPPGGSRIDETEVKLEEFRVRRLEAERALLEIRRPWWRAQDPLVVGILAGFLTLIGNIVAETMKSHDEVEVERFKARYSLVLQAMATNDNVTAAKNIQFFIQSGLLDDADRKIITAVERLKPVLPSAGAGATETAGGATVGAVAKSYDLPAGMDGTGQTVGVVELNGGYNDSDLNVYFANEKVPRPSIHAVSVLGGANRPGSNSDYEVEADLEIIGAIVPRADQRVYFAPPTAQGMIASIAKATADRVGVLSISWGWPETKWTASEREAMESALKSAANHGVTVVAAAGDQGVTNGASDRRAGLIYPASSPWALAVGGTSLATSPRGAANETPWIGKGPDQGSGHGVSGAFPRPSWQQAAVGRGRAIPDVVASADPEHGDTLFIHGQSAVLGGTGMAAPLWAAQIVQINQALGRPVGFFNPCLYTRIGPSGVLRSVKAEGGPGSVAKRAAWNSLTGWGSPSGQKLINWVQTNGVSACIAK